jgi:hypothetical protein
LPTAEIPGAAQNTQYISAVWREQPTRNARKHAQMREKTSRGVERRIAASSNLK